MKNISALAAILLFSPTAVVAGEYQRGYSHDRTCFRTEYREEYIPGTEYDPGYVKSWKETVEVPCNEDVAYERDRHPSEPVASNRRHVTVYEVVDSNDCYDGTLAGALLGGGLAGFGSRGKDRWWAIPAGIIGSSMVGCAVDGG